MKVLVTGGCGFIGSNLVKNLVEKEKLNVKIIDNLSTGSIRNIYPIRRDNKGMIEFTDHVFPIRNQDIDFIYHLGMPSSSPMYKDNPHLMGVTIDDAITLFEWARTRDIKRIVIASSSSLYNGNTTPFNEGMEIDVTDFYTETRLAIERLAQLYQDLYGLNFVILRLFSVYGPNETHKGRYANMLTQIMWDMYKNKSPKIYGNGTQKRDFIYVSDVVNAFRYARTYINYTKYAKIFNVGTGRMASFNDIVVRFNRLMGKRITIDYRDVPKGNYVQETLADIELARLELGFNAVVSWEYGLQLMLKMYYPKVYGGGERA